jgi:DNA mismatch repair protein MSH5
LIQRHDVARLLDEAMSEEEQRDLADAEEVCRRFLAVDLTSKEGRTDVLSTDIKQLLAQVLSNSL